MNTVKECIKCNIVKPFSDYSKGKNLKYGLQRECKPCRKQMYHDNKSYYINKNKNRVISSEERQTNYDRNNNRYHNDVEVKLKLIARRGITRYMKMEGDDTIEGILGCSIKEFREYIESLFTECMSWDNYGRLKSSWQLDHCIPLDWGNSRSDNIELNAYQNWQPLWLEDHKAKTINDNIIRDCSKIKGGKIGKQKSNDRKS